MLDGMEKPKYQQLKSYIIEMIESQELKAGDRISSENELAARFEISRSTVRQAVGELVSEGFIIKKQGQGTFVNKMQKLIYGRARTIGVITTYLDDYIFPAIIRGIDGVLSQNGYNIMLGCTNNLHEKERLCLENLRQQNIVALVAETTKSALPNPNLDLYREYRDSGIPILFIHGCYKDSELSYIVEDDVEAGYIATKHLIDAGHSAIGGVFKIDDVQGHLRYSGFQKALLEVGLKLTDSRIMWFDTDDMNNKHINEKINQYINNIMSDCTAIVCYNDQIAVETLNFIRGNGLSVPGDLSVVSFDDSQLAVASEIKLTTVAHPKERLGEEAAKAIIDLIEQKKNHFEIKMQPELIVRDSTKQIKKGSANNE
jgi:GntR family transcriptional regulator, arabinose operon transcriptional repressor